MTGGPRQAQAAALVRAQVADGTLRPGQAAPSGGQLARLTGFSPLTCRKALRDLVADGTLARGVSPRARPRVAAAAPERDGDAARSLSGALAALRRAAGLSQPALAAVIGYSVTTVGHAETGRLWQSRQFWERSDAILGAGGALLKLHDVYRAAAASGSADSSQGASGAVIFSRAAGQGHERAAEPYGPPSARALALPPPGGRTGGQVPEPRERWGGEVAAGAAGPHGMEQSSPFPPAARGHAVPACVMIMWGDGTVTTVHPPEAPPAGSALNEAP